VHWEQPKIRSNLHTSQHAGSIPSDHSQGQALVESLDTHSGITKHKQVSLWGHSKRGSGLTIHTSSFKWLAVLCVVFVDRCFHVTCMLIVFLAYLSLCIAISCYFI